MYLVLFILIYGLIEFQKILNLCSDNTYLINL